ncbi:hypothetical protein [Frankia sp. CiP3]|uniref:hypothetical protein n=1 Tax=Frankia sp. CiP3 TaxID=2880971 RepID=UPI001EF45F53|nr:hypothetical protein [Frankia sp. CiP3]
MSLLHKALGAVMDRVPVAGGRMVKELSQSIERTSGVVEKKRRLGFFGRIAETVTGKLQTAVAGDLVRHQREIVIQLDQIRAHGINVDLSIARVSGHLRQVQYGVDHAISLSTRNAADLRELGLLTGHLAGLVGVCQDRLDAHDMMLAEHAAVLRDHAARLAAHAASLAQQDAILREHATLLDVHGRVLIEHDARLNALEFRTMVTDFRKAGEDAVTNAILRWRDGETYTDLPWTLQVLLLGQEIAAGPAGAYELLAPMPVVGGPRAPSGPPGDPRRFQKILTDRILRADGGWEGPKPLAELLIEAVAALAVRDDREMVAEILGIGLVPALAPVTRGPLTDAFALALDQVVREVADDLGRDQAAGVVRHATASRYVHLPSRMTAKAFAELAVAEQASSALAERARLWVPGGPPPAL